MPDEEIHKQNKESEKEELSYKIIYELDMIDIVSKLSDFAIMNDLDGFNPHFCRLIFKDIQKRCDEISETFEKTDSFV